MASGLDMDCAIKFDKIELEREGMKAILNSPEIQSLVHKAAESSCSSANAMLGEDGHNRSGFATKPVQGKFAQGEIVHTQTDHACYANSKRNILRKSLRG